MTELTPEENVAYPISGGFVAITLRFPTHGTNAVNLMFVEDAFENKYVLEVDGSTPLTFALGESPPVVVLGDLPANLDLQFWVDFSSDKFVVGMGSEHLITIDHTITTVSRMIISPGSGTVVTASVCSMRGRASQYFNGGFIGGGCTWVCTAVGLDQHRCKGGGGGGVKIKTILNV